VVRWLALPSSPAAQPLPPRRCPAGWPSDGEGWLLAAPDGAQGADGHPGWNDCRADAANNPRIDGGGHIEPSLTEHPHRVYTAVVGPQNTDVEATEEAFAFFKDKRAGAP
jgi:poly(3-hydroxybutyrate) depolymerase